MIRLFLLFLFAWGMGALFFFLVALSDLAFSKQGTFRIFLKRVALCAVWPLTILSAAGRAQLFHVFVKTQEQEK